MDEEHLQISRAELGLGQSQAVFLMDMALPLVSRVVAGRQCEFDPGFQTPIPLTVNVDSTPS
jgi:hypothetical protein